MKIHGRKKAKEIDLMDFKPRLFICDLSSDDIFSGYYFERNQK